VSRSAFAATWCPTMIAAVPIVTRISVRFTGAAQPTEGLARWSPGRREQSWITEPQYRSHARTLRVRVVRIPAAR
jgi:hypothetical protein